MASHPHLHVRRTFLAVAASLSAVVTVVAAVAMGAYFWTRSQIETIDPEAGHVDPALSIAPDAGAYVYYTSGSTGRAKGVLDSHRNVLHNVMRYTNTLLIGPDDRLTLLQGPSFSGAVSSLFGALMNGASTFPFDVPRSGVDRIAPWLERAMDEASRAAFGKLAVSMGEGGSIPFMAMLGARFPEAQFLVTGVLGPGSNAHGPNEFLHLDYAKRLTACVADQGEQACEPGGEERLRILRCCDEDPSQWMTMCFLLSETPQYTHCAEVEEGFSDCASTHEDLQTCVDDMEPVLDTVRACCVLDSEFEWCPLI